MDSIIAGVVTMTSLELVDFINSERTSDQAVLAHSDFMKKVPQVLGEGAGLFSDTYQHPQNSQFYPMYRLPKREACLMAMSYSYVLQAKVFDRMCAMEQALQPAFKVPTTLSGALRLAAEQAEVIEQQALQLEAVKPAVEFVDRYCDSTGAKGFRQVAKLLQVKEHVFREFLIEKKIMYRLAGELTPHAPHLEAGRFVVKAGHAEANNHAFNSARFTPKGVNWVAGEFAKHQVEQQLALH